VKIMGLQLDISWEDKQANFRKVRHLLEKAAPAAGTLVVLPEMFATGFSMNVAAVAEPYQGETEKFLSALAMQHAVYVLGGAAMIGKTGRARNKALLFAPNGEMVGYYAKMRPFSVGGETEHYAAGDRPMSFSLPGITMAPLFVMTCVFQNCSVKPRPPINPNSTPSSPTGRRSGLRTGRVCCKPARLKTRPS